MEKYSCVVSRVCTAASTGAARRWRSTAVSGDARILPATATSSFRYCPFKDARSMLDSKVNGVVKTVAFC
jgi:hypothetical protein